MIDVSCNIIVCMKCGLTLALSYILAWIIHYALHTFCCKGWVCNKTFGLDCNGTPVFVLAPKAQLQNVNLVVLFGLGVTVQQWAGGTGCIKNPVHQSAVVLHQMVGPSKGAPKATDFCAKKVCVKTVTDLNLELGTSEKYYCGGCE